MNDIDQRIERLRQKNTPDEYRFAYVYDSRDVLAVCEELERLRRENYEGRCAAMEQANKEGMAEMERLRAVVAEQGRLLGSADMALTLATKWAEFTRQHWDADRDAKVGKCLIALAGGCPGYAPDTDGIHAYWRQIKEYRNGSH